MFERYYSNKLLNEMEIILNKALPNLNKLKLKKILDEAKESFDNILEDQERKIYFGKNEDGELMVVGHLGESLEERWFRKDGWEKSGSAGDIFRMNSITVVEALRLCKGILPDFIENKTMKFEVMILTDF